jgi:hypothetical protein
MTVRREATTQSVRFFLRGGCSVLFAVASSATDNSQLGDGFCLDSANKPASALPISQLKK